ncbi:MAG TPA: ATP-binding protein [Azospirillum sp.]|nr:ATP-binding protein [Azospirillum sp.]
MSRSAPAAADWPFETPQERILRLERRVAELEADQNRLTATIDLLRDREELLSLAMRGPNEGLWDWNPITKDLYLSARLLSILGFGSNELCTTTHEWLKIVHPEDRGPYERAVSEHLKGVTGHFEHAYRLADHAGNWRWVLARGLALRGADGQAYRMVGSIGDITELKRRESDLRASEARFRSLVRTAGGIILVLGADGVVAEANREAERAFALPAGGAVGRNWRDLIPEQQGGPFAYQLVAAMAGMEIRNFEHAWSDHDGGERVVLWNMNRMPETEGVAPAIVCVGQDITRRKRAELALREAHDDLEARVAARTAELSQEVQERRRAEEALLAAKEQAELANRAKSDFLANMSHELRTPLNAVIGFASMIQGELVGPVGTPRYAEYGGLIVASGEHLLAVINDILDIAKVEAGKFEMHPQPVDARDAVASSVQLIRGRAGEGGVQLSVQVADDTPPVLADPVRLKQILINLLSNAVKFTPAGGRVELRARRDGAWGLIEVADTGIGMSAEGIAVALQPFGQVDSHLARRHGGTGLGLPLARSFVDLMRGTLSIDSVEGRGTTVRVRLPAAG